MVENKYKRGLNLDFEMELHHPNGPAAITKALAAERKSRCRYFCGAAWERIIFF